VVASGKAHLNETGARTAGLRDVSVWLCDLTWNFAIRSACRNAAEVAEIKAKKASKKEKRKAAFGWDVFNQDSLYKGYKKRLVSLPTAVETAASTSVEDTLGDELAYGKDDKVEEVRAKMHTYRDYPLLGAPTPANEQCALCGKMQESVERMAQEVEDRIKARKKFSRRRQHYEGEDVDYINGQNRIFNRKASQAFDKYTVEIRQNLERGTAL
jgi:pre-mRNA-splicing factor SYF2